MIVCLQEQARDWIRKVMAPLGLSARHTILQHVVLRAQPNMVSAHTDRHRETDTDTQTHKQRNKETNKQMNKQTNKQTNRDRQTHIQTRTHTHIYTDRYTHRDLLSVPSERPKPPFFQQHGSPTHVPQTLRLSSVSKKTKRRASAMSIKPSRD